MSRNCFCVSPPPAPFFYSTISLCVLEYISIRKLQHYYYVQLGTLDRKKLEFLKRVCIRSILLLFRCSLSQASMSVNTPPVHTWKALSSFSINRQVKDQNKKVANLKHKEQVEKKGGQSQRQLSATAGQSPGLKECTPRAGPPLSAVCSASVSSSFSL